MFGRTLGDTRFHRCMRFEKVIGLFFFSFGDSIQRMHGPTRVGDTCIDRLRRSLLQLTIVHMTCSPTQALTAGMGMSSGTPGTCSPSGGACLDFKTPAKTRTDAEILLVPCSGFSAKVVQLNKNILWACLKHIVTQISLLFSPLTDILLVDSTISNVNT